MEGPDRYAVRDEGFSGELLLENFTPKKGLSSSSPRVDSDEYGQNQGPSVPTERRKRGRLRKEPLPISLSESDVVLLISDAPSTQNVRKSIRHRQPYASGKQLRGKSRPSEGMNSTAKPKGSPTLRTSFAHASESDFARILDFYKIQWVYEPRSFPLRWKGDRILEMFTPDFYLPDMDLYVELTTLKQSLVTEKNRKLRLLREIYPKINIKLLYRRDYHRLLAKYGYGPLAKEEARGIERVLLSSLSIRRLVQELAFQISEDYQGHHLVLLGVMRGALCFVSDLMRQISVPLSLDFMSISYFHGDRSEDVKITKDLDIDITGRDVLLVEDIVDTGMTLNVLLEHVRAQAPASLEVCALLDKRVRRLVDIPIRYVGLEVPDEFVVGYGLDHLETYRNLPFLGVLKPGPQLVPLNQSLGEGISELISQEHDQNSGR